MSAAASPVSRCALALLVFLVACGAAIPLPPPPPAPAAVPWPTPIATVEAPRVTPDAPFRDHVPDGGPAVKFVPPKIESFALKNGVRVLLVERHELPIVSVRVVVKAGAGDLPNERPGVLSFVGAMLEQGTQKRSALQISDEYDAIGASHGAWVDWDAGGATVKVVASHLDEALDLLSDVVLHPSFPDAEIDRLKARRLASVQQEKNSPGAMATNAVAASLYGRAHPYGHSINGREADVAKLARAELVHAYAGLFAPSRAAIVVAGDVTRDAVAPKLEASFGAWKGTAAQAKPPKPPPPDAAGAPRVVFVDRARAPQSQVLLAEVGVARSATDRDAVAVMNTLLGGMFSSRINLNLREAHAYTYGARSRFVMGHGAGPFTAGGAIVAEKTAPAIHELFREIDGMRERAVSAEELADAKEAIKLGMPGRFETVAEVTGAVSDLFIYDLPLDEYATRPARIEAVTAEDVQKAAKAHLHPSSLKVVVVGDRATLQADLEQLHLGAIEARDAFGDPIK